MFYLEPNNLIKDIFMLTALTLSLFGCIFAFSKHRKSQEQIKKMMKEFDKIGNDEQSLLPSSKRFILIIDLKFKHSF